MRRFAALLVLAPALLAPAQAHAEKGLWATVNACDTERAPATIGIRASMPGNGTRQRLYMRFQVERFSVEQDRFVRTDASSRWLHVGSARFRSTQKGFNFQFGDLPPGDSVLRGRVDFQWRVRRRGRLVVVRRAKRFTRAGIRGVEAADPPGRSSALCVISR